MTCTYWGHDSHIVLYQNNKTAAILVPQPVLCEWNSLFIYLFCSNEFLFIAASHVNVNTLYEKNNWEIKDHQNTEPDVL